MLKISPDNCTQVFLLGSRFEQMSARYPQAPALTLGGERLTYSDLNARANRLAACLRGLGVGVEPVVGIRLERSFDLLASIFAVLKAGGAYLPLDLASPKDRVAFMLKDSGARVLLTDSRIAAVTAHDGVETICLDQIDLQLFSPENIETSVHPDSAAYVIYTSGSTGTPKGVLVTHENVSRLFTSTEPWFQFRPQDVWTFFHSCAFDFSVWEIFGALLHGGRLVVVPYAVSRSAEAFRELVVQEKVTVLNQTPSAFRQFMQADGKKAEAELALRTIIFGGEALTYRSLAPWFARYGEERPRCINMYGITETTVHVTYHPITQKEVESGSGSNIGRPLPDLQVYVVDPEGRCVPPGKVGEMLVGGKGVARGYLNRPELTRERFIPNPFEPELSARLYRSGDSARVLPNGELEYLGRIDQQVKIRGFRIELNEIESALARSPGVKECAVVARPGQGGEPGLVAYLVADPSAVPTIEALRAHLAQSLPEYMVPGVYVFLDSFPLTLNGKLDGDKLPAPGTDRPRLAEKYVAPEGELEASLAKIWRKILNLDAIGTRDNFFNLGGDSLSAMKMLAQVETLIGREIGIRPLLEGATIGDLAATIREAAPAAPPPMMTRVRAGDGNRPFFFAHGDYVHGGFYCQKMVQKLGPDQTFYALAPHGTFGVDLPPTIEEMAADYVALIRSVQPKGPYHLGGFCNGAVIIYEVAQQLSRAGETVAMLVLLDPPDLFFFVLRRRIMEMGKFLGLPEGQSRHLYQRMAEGIGIWREEGALGFLKAFRSRLVAWLVKLTRQLFENRIESSRPNLNFHYYEAMGSYEPVAYLGNGPVWIILRQGESGMHPQQIRFWSGFIKNPAFEIVSGTHLEFNTSVDEISGIIATALRKVA